MGLDAGLTRAQQLKALGNGVVPQQARLALTLLDRIGRAACGWEASGCVRVVLDGAGTGMAQRHRTSCPKRPGVPG